MIARNACCVVIPELISVGKHVVGLVTVDAGIGADHHRSTIGVHPTQGCLDDRNGCIPWGAIGRARLFPQVADNAVSDAARRSSRSSGGARSMSEVKNVLCSIESTPMLRP